MLGCAALKDPRACMYAGMCLCVFCIACMRVARKWINQDSQKNMGNDCSTFASKNHLCAIK